MTRICSILLLVAGHASASGVPPRPETPGIPGLRVTGPALLRDVRIVVSCAGSDFYEPHATCTVDLDATLVTEGDARIEPDLPADRSEYTEWALAGDDVIVAGTPLQDVRVVPAATTVPIHIHGERYLGTSRWWSMAPFLWGATPIRHLFLGTGPTLRWTGANTGSAFVAGIGTRIDGTVHVDASAAGFVDVIFAGEEITGVSDVTATQLGLQLRIDVPPADPSLLEHGGPVIAGGVRFPLGVMNAQLQPAMRVGYEMGFAEHMLASIWFETDFDSIYESIMIGAATPQIFILFGSLEGGMGLVLRQLGQRNADAAIRFELGYNMFCVGLIADFDYWPANSEWTASLLGRFSL